LDFNAALIRGLIIEIFIKPNVKIEKRIDDNTIERCKYAWMIWSIKRVSWYG